MSSTLCNPTQFPVLVAELRKQLAPFESIAVKDADVLKRAIASGVLTDDVSKLDDAIKARAKEEASRLGRDVKDAEADVRKAVAVWHDEHDAPVDQVAKSDEVCEVPRDARPADGRPAEDARRDADGTPETPAERVVAQRKLNRQGVEVNAPPEIEFRDAEVKPEAEVRPDQATPKASTKR